MLSRFDMWPALCLVYLSESKQTRNVRLAEWEDQLPDVYPVREHAQVQDIGTSPPGQRSCPSDRFPVYIGRNAASAFSAPPPLQIIGTDPNPIFNFSGWPKIRFTQATFARRRCGGRSCFPTIVRFPQAVWDACFRSVFRVDHQIQYHLGRRSISWDEKP